MRHITPQATPNGVVVPLTGICNKHAIALVSGWRNTYIFLVTVCFLVSRYTEFEVVMACALDKGII